MDWWFFEKSVAADGWSVVCGVDEAGRGCLAGPVYAAAVILPPGLLIDGLDDSKKLTPAKRDALYDIIVEQAVSWAVGSADVGEIESLNILNATYLAMNRAIARLDPAPQVALIDGNRATGVDWITRCVVGGDGQSASIAAASVLAKVSRDRFMTELSAKHPEYQFDRHKGYGTAMHRERLAQYGPSSVHRKKFLVKILNRAHTV